MGKHHSINIEIGKGNADTEYCGLVYVGFPEKIDHVMLSPREARDVARALEAQADRAEADKGVQ